MEDFKNKMIKALLKKIEEVHELETKLTVYEVLLSDEEKEAADKYAEAIIKRGKKHDTP